MRYELSPNYVPLSPLPPNVAFHSPSSYGISRISINFERRPYNTLALPSELKWMNKNYQQRLHYVSLSIADKNSTDVASGEIGSDSA